MDDKAMGAMKALIRALEVGPGPLVKLMEGPALQITTYSEELPNGDIVVRDLMTSTAVRYFTKHRS